MQPNISYPPSPFNGICIMCSLMMFVFGAFLVIPGIVMAAVTRQNLYVWMSLIGAGIIPLLGATCCCCFVRKERKKELKYIMNTSSVVQCKCNIRCLI